MSDEGVEVMVESYGMTIPEEQEEKIYVRGYRAPAAEKSKIAGNGLGLYAAKLIADAHESRMKYSREIRDSVGNGYNRFVISIPAAR